MTERRRVFLDLETGGLDHEKHAIVQVSMIACEDVPEFPELERMEVKVLFSMSHADPEALEGNSYDADVWAEEAVMPDEAADMIQRFLLANATRRHKSPRGWQGIMTEIAGYNVEFDYQFLRTWMDRRKVNGKKPFAPIWPAGLDVKQLALWRWHGEVGSVGISLPASYSLEDVARCLGLLAPGEDQEHDAEFDNDLCIRIARELRA